MMGRKQMLNTAIQKGEVAEPKTKNPYNQQQFAFAWWWGRRAARHWPRPDYPPMEAEDVRNSLFYKTERVS
jgi:hypothetical protein